MLVGSDFCETEARFKSKQLFLGSKEVQSMYSLFYLQQSTLIMSTIRKLRDEDLLADSFEEEDEAEFLDASEDPFAVSHHG